MSLEYTCPVCNAVLLLPPSVMGKSVRCSKCQTVFIATPQSSVPLASPFNFTEPESGTLQPAPELPNVLDFSSSMKEDSELSGARPSAGVTLENFLKGNTQSRDSSPRYVDWGLLRAAFCCFMVALAATVSCEMYRWIPSTEQRASVRFIQDRAPDSFFPSRTEVVESQIVLRDSSSENIQQLFRVVSALSLFVGAGFCCMVPAKTRVRGFLLPFAGLGMLSVLLGTLLFLNVGNLIRYRALWVLTSLLVASSFTLWFFALYRVAGMFRNEQPYLMIGVVVSAVGVALSFLMLFPVLLGVFPPTHPVSRDLVSKYFTTMQILFLGNMIGHALLLQEFFKVTKYRRVSGA